MNLCIQNRAVHGLIENILWNTIQYTVCMYKYIRHKNQTKADASTLSVSGSVFMQRFRFFLSQCSQKCISLPSAEFNLNTFITSGSTQNYCNLYFFCQLYHHRSQMSVIGQESFLYRLQILIRSDPDLFCRIQSQTKRTEYYPYRN